MSETPYSKREIDQLIHEIRESFQEQGRDRKENFEEQNHHLREIKEQVKLTNGRVGSLENWRWFITGGLAIIAIIIIPLLFIIIQKTL